MWPQVTTKWFMAISLIVCFTLFGIAYGVVISTVNNDAYNKNKDAYTTIGITSIILVSILGLISTFTIIKDPSYTTTYLLIITHISLLLSLLSVTAAFIH